MVLADAAQRPVLLRDFVERWYDELDRAPKPGLPRQTAMHERPWWHGSHEGDGTYFGYWCIEAVAVARAFNVDDAFCLGLPHDPADLMRPHGPSTHVATTARTPPTGRMQQTLWRLWRRA